MAIQYKLKEHNSEKLVFKAGNSLWVFIVLFGLAGGIPLAFSLLSFAVDGIMAPNNLEPQVMLIRSRIDIFHCRFTDVRFSFCLSEIFYFQSFERRIAN